MRLAHAALVLPFTLPFVLARALGGTSTNPALPIIQFHDNTTAAGRVMNGELTLSLEIQRAMWHPYGEQRGGREMFAFAEAGGTAVMPAPMLRVKVGTKLHVSIRNPTDSTFIVHGLQSRQAALADSLILAPGEAREARFTADAQGTFYYYATFRGQSLNTSRFDDAILAGAYIVDGASGAPKNEHVVVLSMTFDSRNPNGTASFSREQPVMNGRPWPYTPRHVYSLGDSVRFRFINASNDTHPMHLHGAFFRVDSRGVLLSDSVYSASEQRMAVTEKLTTGTTTSLVWSPERPGTWLLHCHHFAHTTPNIGYGADQKNPEELRLQREEHARMDPNHHVVQVMGGLMMALEIRPPAGWTLNAPARRQLRLVLPDDSTARDSSRFFTPSVGDGDRLTPPVTREGPGAPLILRQGEPTTIQVVNNSPDATGIHWHGMELESYYDGVVGVGGTPGQITTAVMPRSTFEARMTPPRAGTFIYHTHLFETRQVARGLYGAMVVMPSGEEFDPTRDHLYVMGVTRTHNAALNGLRALPPLQFTAGESHRLRFINITVTNAGLQMHLLAADSTATQWLAVAKDGMDLPVHQRVMRTARQPVSIGETYDFMFTPPAPGRYLLQMRAGGGNVVAQQPIEVTARR